MNLSHYLKKQLYETRWSAWLRFTIFTAVGILVWKFSSKWVHDLLIWLAFIYALSKARKSRSVWRNSAGFAFIALLGFIVVSLPLGVSPNDSLRDFIGILDILAAAFAISVLFDRPARIESALLYSASALTFVLGFDLIRMGYFLRDDLMEKAHSFEPFILNHSNVASMAAGAAIMVLCYFAWTWRRDPFRCLACIAGILVNLAYKIVIASRGPQIVFAVTVAASGFILLTGRRRRLVWLLLIIAAGALVTANAKRINPRFADRVSMRGFCERNIVWEQTWKLAQDHPALGHGYGKRTFEKIYHSSNPPASRFYFHHTHEYWLMVLFSQGWVGVILYAAAWLLLMLRLFGRIFRTAECASDRYLPGLIALLILFIHVYGLGDFPDSIIQIMLIWLIPAALVVTYKAVPAEG